MAWISIDPEAGLYHDEFGGTHVYEDTGKTLAEEFPEWHFECPWWAALLLDVTGWIHGRAQRLVSRWQTKKQWPHDSV